MDQLTRYYPNAGALLESWKGHINTVEQVLGDKFTLDRKVVLAVCLENTKQQIQQAERFYETTQPTDIGPFKKFAFELVTAVVPNLIATDIVSVQPMTNRVGEIRYIKYLYGSDKGSVRKGTEFTSAFQLGNSNFNYSSETVDEEVLASAGQSSYSVNLAYFPVRPGTLKITVGANEYVDDGNGNITGPGLTSGTVNYQTGAVNLTFDSATGDDLIASYEYQLDYAPVNVPQVDIKIESLPIIARNRKLRALYAFDAAFDMQRDYGVDINAALLSQISAEIRHEIDGEILNDLLVQAGATASPLTWSKTPATGVSLNEHYASFFNKIVEAGNAIFAATKRASATFVVVGTDAANIIETLPQFTSSGLLNPVGPHLAGYLNNSIPVYKNPYYAAGEVLVGYKGLGIFDAGYVYAPYMPIMTTSLIMMDDFLGRRGFATSYGKKMVNNKLYCRVQVTA